MDKFIHHDSFMPEHGEDGDAFDVIEDIDGFGVYGYGMTLTIHDTLAEATAEAERRALAFDQEWLGQQRLTGGA